MACLALVTGGSRSGKSDYALRLAESLAGPHCFLATSVPQDEEMRQRIRLHQADREPSRWRTVEAPLELAAAIRREGRAGVCLVDCLPLWISNLMAAAHDSGQVLGERELAPLAADLASAGAEVPATVILVTGEVGMGTVPDHPVARLFRDLLGRCNQLIAQHARFVTLVTCGLPLRLKGNSP